MNYQIAYNKIIDAYFKDEIEPYNNNFCFCGTLSPDSLWGYQNAMEDNGRYEYSQGEFRRMEEALLGTINRYYCKRNVFVTTKNKKKYPFWEDALFEGMCAALEVLKDIHCDRGEKVDAESVFHKRHLLNS